MEEEIDKRGKEFEQAAAEVNEKMDVLNDYISEHPNFTNAPEEATLKSEYVQARDKFFLTWNKLQRAIQKAGIDL